MKLQGSLEGFFRALYVVHHEIDMPKTIQGIGKTPLIVALLMERQTSLIMNARLIKFSELLAYLREMGQGISLAIRVV